MARLGRAQPFPPQLPLFYFFTPVTAVNALAEVATGTGTAYNASISIGVSSGSGSGTGTASDPLEADAVNAGTASGTGTATGAAGNISGSGGAASGAGSSNAPSPSIAVNPTVASGTGTASGATPTISLNAESASGAGSASGAADTIAPIAGVASGAGTAFDATVTVSGLHNAPADPASGSGTAFNPSITTVIGAKGGHQFAFAGERGVVAGRTKLRYVYWVYTTNGRLLVDARQRISVKIRLSGAVFHRTSAINATECRHKSRTLGFCTGRSVSRVEMTPNHRERVWTVEQRRLDDLEALMLLKL